MRAHPALVLNADFQPLNYFPLSTMDWETAVKNVYEGNLSVVAEYDTVVRSPSTTMRLPSVVAMRDFVPIPKRVAFTRFNVFLRDRFRCQYCGGRFGANDLTFDQAALVRRRDGMAQCGRSLRSLQPAQVQSIRHTASSHAGRKQLIAAKRMFPPNYLHESWLDYLYWDSEIEN